MLCVSKERNYSTNNFNLGHLSAKALNLDEICPPTIHPIPQFQQMLLASSSPLSLSLSLSLSLPIRPNEICISRAGSALHRRG